MMMDNELLLLYFDESFMRLLRFLQTKNFIIRECKESRGSYNELRVYAPSQAVKKAEIFRESLPYYVEPNAGEICSPLRTGYDAHLIDYYENYYDSEDEDEDFECLPYISISMSEQQNHISFNEPVIYLSTAEHNPELFVSHEYVNTKTYNFSEMPALQKDLVERLGVHHHNYDLEIYREIFYALETALNSEKINYLQRVYLEDNLKELYENLSANLKN